MLLRSLALSFVLLTVFVVSCKSPRKSDSITKDVIYVDGALNDRFTYSEICNGPWRSTPDANCMIRKLVEGTVENEVPSDRVYRALKMPEPAGDLGAEEVAKKQERINGIGPADVRRQAQQVLEELKSRIATKNIIKTVLAEGGDRATCFKDEHGESKIGPTKVTCAQLETIIADEGYVWEMPPVRCLVESATYGRGKVLAFSRELRRVRVELSGGAGTEEMPFAGLRDLNSTCTFLQQN
jgi:hypothetical protein